MHLYTRGMTRFTKSRLWHPHPVSRNVWPPHAISQKARARESRADAAPEPDEGARKKTSINQQLVRDFLTKTDESFSIRNQIN